MVTPRQGHAQGQTSRRRLHHRPTRLGKKCRPKLQGQPLPRTRDRREGRRISRQMDRLWQGRWLPVFHRQGNHDRTGPNRDHQRQRRVFADRGARRGLRQQTAPELPETPALQ